MHYFETNLFEIIPETEYILVYSNVKIISNGIYKYSNYNNSLNIEKKSNNYILYKITDKNQIKYLINIKVEEPELTNNSVVISFIDNNLNNIINIIYDFYYFDRLSKYKYKIINDSNHNNYSIKKILKNIKQVGLDTQTNTIISEQEERDELKSQYDTFRTERDELKSQYDTFRTERDELKSQYDTFRTERDELKSQYDTLKAVYLSTKSQQYDIINKLNILLNTGKKIGLNFF